MARALAAMLVLAAFPVRAEPGWVTFETWLRAAPAAEARVIDELRMGQRVERLGCGAGWCQVMAERAGGFVAEALLASAPAAPLQRAEGDCFPAQHFTPAGPVALRICPAVAR